MKVYDRLLSIIETKGAGYFVLIDPDRKNISEIIDVIAASNENGVDAILIGSSILLSFRLDERLKKIKKLLKIPLILFPGHSSQLSQYFDSVLFLSLISGRNPDHLIGNQVVAAPSIKEHGLEVISTGYILIDSGRVTSAEFMSNTRPIPRDKTDIAKAHALAGEYLGMKLIYLEAGSGAEYSVPEAMIQEVSEYISRPLIVGGGIRKPEEARKKVEAGASFIVTGNIFEKDGNLSLIREFSEAVHRK